ncbi:hypothetical protein [Candidatus Parabeggiatoa sp. HSG14]|uniref:hypothetical protein n=1 Tax=Candidatus Parabeggiatoa sp. HSG14 TaxID=3055593 RepID=UPI0025A72922|nr:hypothetical protein [Thiotrichales bacterium HSG14]
MTQQPHDQFAKQFLTELFEPLKGEIRVNYEVHAERRYVDIYFSPPATITSNPHFQALGLLGKMVEKACLLEPFRSPPNQSDVNNCILKLLTVHNELQTNRARHNENPLPQEQRHRLWIIATSASDPLLDNYRTQPNLFWGKGIYFLPEPLKTAIVAIDRLPITPQTLYLRMLGKGTTQQQAIKEFLTLFPQTNPIGQYVLELLTKYRIYLETKDKLTEDEGEILMNLEATYFKWKEETKLEGLQQGLQRGLQQGRLEMQRTIVEQALKLRFGVVDDILSPLVEPLLQLSTEESLRLLMQASREELLAKFSH